MFKNILTLSYGEVKQPKAEKRSFLFEETFKEKICWEIQLPICVKWRQRNLLK